jgi:hypothetical protein
MLALHCCLHVLNIYADIHFDKLDILNILLSYVVIIILIFIFRMAC